MTLILTRNKYQSDGIFSTLMAENGGKAAETVEHAYPYVIHTAAASIDAYMPKLGVGTYTCVRGTHKLHDGIPFETFEITGVKGHDNILFHVGNYNADSEGCVLLGEKTVKASPHTNSTLMVTNSKATFAKFMELLKGIDSFTLLVK